jgi:hypothetical protein
VLAMRFDNNNEKVINKNRKTFFLKSICFENSFNRYADIVLEKPKTPITLTQKKSVIKPMMVAEKMVFTKPDLIAI